MSFIDNTSLISRLIANASRIAPSTMHTNAIFGVANEEISNCVTVQRVA